MCDATAGSEFGAFPIHHSYLWLQQPEAFLMNDIVPSQTSALERFVEKLNLPEVVAGPAGKAISRLVAGVFDVPGAYLDRLVQGIKDKTEARSLVNKEVATAAAKLASGDNEIIARAAHNLLAKEYRKQNNKEEIARKTVELLQHQPQSSGPEQPSPSSTPKDVDEDWLNVFERYAEDASSDRLREIWARVLAGEIRKPTTFSLQSLRFISELDERSARLFEKYAPRIIGDFIPYPERSGAEFSEMLELEQYGLITGVGSGLTKTFTLTAGFVALPMLHGLFCLQLDASASVKLNCVLLTRVGSEIMQILKPSPELPWLESIAKKVPKAGLVAISYASFGGPLPGRILWFRPAPTEEQK
jgi:hypothetical protein